MKRREFLQTCAAGAIAAGIDTAADAQSSGSSALEEAFRNPPASAHARTWWHWMNGNISEIGITRDLEAMKRVGCSGFQMFQVGTGIPKGPVDYGSEKHIELLRHAAREADRLGLEFAMHNCPGWSSSGGPWITPELSMQTLTWSETFVTGGQRVQAVLTKPPTHNGYYRDAMVVAFPAAAGEEHGPARKAIGQDSPVTMLEFEQPVEARSVTVYWEPAGNVTAANNGRLGTLAVSQDGTHYDRLADLTILRSGRRGLLEVPLIASFPVTRARYFQFEAAQPMRVIDVRFSAASRVDNWMGKAGFAGRPNSQPVADPGGPFVAPASVVDITRFTDADGHLDWTAPAGAWTILRIGHTTTGAINSPGPEGGIGLECDKFSREAYQFHFQQYFGKLFDVIAPLAAKGMAGATIDSYETGLQNWTARFPEEFQRRRGYDLKPYMPAMFGRVVGSPEISDRFLWDVRKTHAELMQEYYYGEFQEQCHQHGMKAFIEPYDPGNFDEMPTGQYADMVMGEFWLRDPNQHSIKLVASVGHIYDKKIIAAESFTSSSKWQEHPYNMKTTGDFMYAQGLNNFVFHRYCHQPHPDVAPGMTMGPWGWFFDRTNTWFEKSSGWLKGYVARAQNLLRQGVFVADLLYFTGEDSPQVAPPLSQLHPPPPEGYDWDTIDGGAIETRIQIEKGRIVLPGGVSYGALVLRENSKLSLDLLRKIRDLVNDGMVLVVSSRPDRTPGLTNHPNCDDDVRGIVNEMWGDLDGAAVTDRKFGKGRLFWGRNLADVLREIGMAPDCVISSGSDAPIHWIHRRAGDADLYFIANRRRQGAENVLCTFRVNGKAPELWDAATGEIAKAPVYSTSTGAVSVPVRLEPAGAMFVVFRAPASPRPLRDVVHDRTGEVLRAALPVAAPARVAAADNFTISVWLKPDMDMGIPQVGGRGGGVGAASGLINPTFVFYPPHPESADQASCGLAAGRNGLALYERAGGSPSPLVPVIAAHTAIAGWTHVAVVYRAGAPFLYVDGKLTAQAEKSGKSIRPVLWDSKDAPMDFMGQMARLELIPKPLDDAAIGQLVSAGLPDPEEPPACEVSAGARPGLLFWQDGQFLLRDVYNRESPVWVAGIGKPLEIAGEWKVSFPPNLGAPAAIAMKQLKSLHRHELDGVKYFSGTATYRNQFQLAADAKSPGKRLYLDLGRVEVIAEVLVNGKFAGNLWKFPYRVEITDLVRVGANDLEINVTNLWPNRLIGDEQQPAEYDYAGATGSIRAIPEWYAQGKPKPQSGRIAFTTWKWYSKDDPLLESGLLGPVRVRVAVRREV